MRRLTSATRCCCRRLAHVDLGMAFLQACRTGDALAELRALWDLGDRRRVLLAVMGHTLGEIDEAIEMCEEACDARVGLAVFVKVEHMLDPLRSHPRFSALLKRLKLN